MSLFAVDYVDSTVDAAVKRRATVVVPPMDMPIGRIAGIQDPWGAVFCVLKLAATVCSYSSGGSGGIFAPALFMGGMLGGSIGYIDVMMFHHSADAIGAFAVVGMGAVFAGIVRAPITSILIVFEMTGSYGLVLPLMIANMTAFALARYWRKVPVYEALLAQDGIVLQNGGRPEEPGSGSIVSPGANEGMTEDATA